MFKGQASLVRLGSARVQAWDAEYDAWDVSVSAFTCTMPMCCSCTVEPRLVNTPGKSTPQQCIYTFLMTSWLICPILLMKTSPYNADTAAICFLIPKEVHIIGAPLHVTLNVDCTGYSWTCIQNILKLYVYASHSVFSSRIHKLQCIHFLYALVLCTSVL